MFVFFHRSRCLWPAACFWFTLCVQKDAEVRTLDHYHLVLLFKKPYTDRCAGNKWSCLQGLPCIICKETLTNSLMRIQLAGKRGMGKVRGTTELSHRRDLLPCQLALPGRVTSAPGCFLYNRSRTRSGCAGPCPCASSAETELRRNSVKRRGWPKQHERRTESTHQQK